MNNKEIHEMVLTTAPKTKKLHFSRSKPVVDWLNDNDRCFDEYRDTVTVYCESSEDRRKIEYELRRIES